MAEPLREFTRFIWWMWNGAKRPPTQDQARQLRLRVRLYRLPETTPTILILSVTVPQEQSSNGTHKDKGKQAGPRTHGEVEWSRRWRRHISHGAQWRQQLKTTCNGGNSLVVSAPLQEQQSHKSSHRSRTCTAVALVLIHTSHTAVHIYLQASAGGRLEGWDASDRFNRNLAYCLTTGW